MALRVKDIQDLLVKSPGSARGAALFHRADRNRYQRLTPAQRQFVDDMWGHRPEKPAQVPEHPETAARRKPREQSDLDAAELVWMQRLPHDPKAISFEDATHLASLANAIRATDSPTSARLIESIWAPVKALHDERVATAQVKQARQSKPHVPKTALDALMEAVDAENPGLTDEARQVQGNAVLDQINTLMSERYHGDIAGAERALEAARSAQVQYSETEREVASA